MEQGRRSVINNFVTPDKNSYSKILNHPLDGGNFKVVDLLGARSSMFDVTRPTTATVTSKKHRNLL